MQNSRELSSFIYALKENGLRVTNQRLSIISLLIMSSNPLTISQFINSIPNVNFVTIYRNLDVLVNIGIIHKVPIGFKYKYELSDKYRSHHHHIVCDNCGKSVKINSNKLENEIQTIAKLSGMEITAHVIELRGKCNKC